MSRPTLIQFLKDQESFAKWRVRRVQQEIEEIEEIDEDDPRLDDLYDEEYFWKRHAKELRKQRLYHREDS